MPKQVEPPLTRQYHRSALQSNNLDFSVCVGINNHGALFVLIDYRLLRFCVGIMFQDITTLLLDPKAFRDTIDLFVERYKDQGITVVAGVEARGFIFGPPIALAIGAKFVPLRKPKKLPGEVISEEYSLEYGTDKIEMHVGAVQANDRALVVDDLIATGGTLCAAVKLLERVGAKVVECACVIELPELKGRDKLGDRPVFVLVEADA